MPVVTHLDYQVDLGFIVDSSDAIPTRLWTNLRWYAKAITDSFDISSTRTRVGVVVFSKNARIAFPFNADYTRAGVKQLIDGMQQSVRSEQRIDRALQMAYRDLFSARYGARAEARQVNQRCLYVCLQERGKFLENTLIWADFCLLNRSRSSCGG